MNLRAYETPQGDLKSQGAVVFENNKKTNVWQPSGLPNLFWFFALMAAILIAWTFGANDFYGQGDGKWTQVLIKNYLRFARPFEVNALNPLQANFSQFFPLNVWLNPAVVQFAFLPFETAKFTSMVTFLSVQAI